MNTEKERSGMFNILLRTLQKMIKRGRFLNELSMDDRRDTWKITADPVIEYVNRHVVKMESESISYDELYAHFTTVIEQTEAKLILKPTFNRKILTLTGAVRSSNRVSGIQKQVFNGITLRSKLKDNKQASLD